MRAALLSRQAVVIAAVAVLGAFGVAPAVASAAAGRFPAQLAVPTGVRPAGLAEPAQAGHLPAGERHLCPAPTRPGQMECMSIIRTPPAGGASTGPAGSVPGYGPSALLSAYKLRVASARNGRGRTVAIVDAFNDPHAAANLATYRRHFGLPACTEKSRCLRIINEHGHKSPLPTANADWAGEESLDLDMVSAICPKCHIVLVEASSSFDLDLGTAEDTAVATGARYVSNSWSGGEFVGESDFNHFFNHPGDAIAFAAGDFGYDWGFAGSGAEYPADIQYVTAVGGTTLRRAHGKRGWTESVWGVGNSPGSQGTASGCSSLQAKPSWQRTDNSAPAGCLNRTENDVAAIGNPSTGVAVYDTFDFPGWIVFGGTSVATPIITATYALAGTPSRGSYPSEYPYLHNKHFFNVRTGTNGRCEPNRQYLCNGRRGYNGPTGLGTPNGTAGFTNGKGHLVTLVDPGVQDEVAGAHFSLRITGLDTRTGARSLTYHASGLPAGLSIAAVHGTVDALITGTLPGTPGSFKITVTAKDGSTAGSTTFTIVTVPPLTDWSPPENQIPSGTGTVSQAVCLDTPGGSAVDIADCAAGNAQLWSVNEDGTISSDSGLCLAVSGNSRLDGAAVVLAGCNSGDPSQIWFSGPRGELVNFGSGRCLADPGNGGAGTRLSQQDCYGKAGEIWGVS